MRCRGPANDSHHWNRQQGGEGTVTKTVGRMLFALLLIAISPVEAANLAAQRRTARMWGTPTARESSRAMRPTENFKSGLNDLGSGVTSEVERENMSKNNGHRKGEWRDPALDQGQ